MDHRHFDRLAAGDALDDLDAAERLGFGRHLAGCARCPTSLVELDEAVADLALLAAPRRVPAQAHHALIAAIRATDASSIRGATRIPRLPSLRRLSRLPAARFSLGAAAVLVVAAAGFGLRDVTIGGELASARATAETAGSRAGAMAARLASATTRLDAVTSLATLMAEPAHKDAALAPEPLAPGAAASIIFEPGTTLAYVVARGLPPTPADRVYQLWVADAAGVHALGTYRYDGQGPFVAAFGVDLAGSTAAMLTSEPIGGTQGAPGPQLVFGELPAS